VTGTVGRDELAAFPTATGADDPLSLAADAVGRLAVAGIDAAKGRRRPERTWSSGT
jgi:hypothetical protein